MSSNSVRLPNDVVKYLEDMSAGRGISIPKAAQTLVAEHKNFVFWERTRNQILMDKMQKEEPERYAEIAGTYVDPRTHY